jgi:hypothetical protein
MTMTMLLAFCGTALRAADLPTWQLATQEAGTLANWSAPADAAGRRFRSAEGGQTATLSVPAWWGAGFRPPEGTVYVLEVVYQDVATNPVVFLSHGGVGKYWGLTELHRFGGAGDGQWKTAHIPCSWDLVCRKNNFKDLTDRTEFGLQSATPLPVEAITVTVAGPDAAERYRRETREWVAGAQAAKRATASCGEKQPALLEGEWAAKPAVPFVRTYMAALLQNATPQRGETGCPLELRLAQNEYETAGFAVYANGAALSDVDVSGVDLKGPDGATLPVRLQAAEYSVVREGKGWLMWPQRFWPAYPVDIAAGQSHAFWLTVQSKAGQTQPGVYTGTVRIRSGKIEAELPVRAEVLPVMLPTMQEAGLDLGACGFPTLQDLKTMAEYNHTGVDIWFGGAQQQMRVRDGNLEMDSTYLDDWMRYAARHGMTHMMWFMGGDPYGFPDTMNLERDLYRAQEGENNTLRRAFLDKTNEKPDAVIPEVRDLYVQWVRQTAENAQRKGWPGKLIIHPFDEPAKWVQSSKWENPFHPVIGAGKWIRPHFEDACALIREGAKGFDNILTGGDMHHAEPSLVFLDDVDVFCSNAIHEDEKLGDKVRAAGVQFWQYSGCGDHSPAHGARFAYGWYFAAYDSRGSLVWAYDSMDRFDTSASGGWGYGWYTPFGTVETPYLIGTREGWDDRRWIEAYRKQVAAKDPASRDALEAILRQAVEKRTDKGKDTVNDFYAEMAGYERMDAWRARLAEALVKAAGGK